jgi:hypothetical protein
MKQRRLQHAADILCHMFCGWRLINCYAEMERLGSGELQVDALTADCVFNGIPIESLSIAHELQHWLLTDLAANNIQSESIRIAKMTAHLSISQISSRTRTTNTQHFDNKERPVTKGTFNRLEIKCHSLISTDKKSFTSSFEDLEEWPIHWPAT